MFRKHKYVKNAEIKSEPYDPKMFGNNNQIVNVSLSIEEKDDGVAECISGCFRMCVSAAKEAK